MVPEVILRALRQRRSVEGDAHIEFEHDTYEFVDMSNYSRCEGFLEDIFYSVYHYTDGEEAGHIHTQTVSVAIIVAVWLVASALLLAIAVLKVQSLRSSALGVILLNLCANNFLYVVITVSWYIEYELHHVSRKGEALCHFRWIMSGTLENTFSLLIILLSVDRLFLLLLPRVHSHLLSRFTLCAVTSGTWVLGLILASIQMYVTTGGIFYHAESGVCYSQGRFAEVIMRTTMHYHLPAFCLLNMTPIIIYLQLSPCRQTQDRDIDIISPGNPTAASIQFDPWDKFSVYLVTCISNLLFLLLWFPETYFYIKGNLYVLTWSEIKAFIGCVYLMVSGKGLIILLFTFGVKDTRDAILFRKRSADQAQLLDMEEVPASSSVME